MSIPDNLVNHFWDKPRERQEEILQHAYDCFVELQAENKRLWEALSFIEGYCFDWMEGAGMPEFKIYGEIMCVAKQALKGEPKRK